MGVIYWQDGAQTFQTATSMQAIAVNAGLWEAYVGFGTKGREIFQQCAKDSFDWSLDTVLAYAAFEDSPQPKASKPQPKASPPQPVAASSSAVRIRARGNAEDTNPGPFVQWMKDVTAAVKQDSSLSYVCGKRRVLPGDGTVAVSVAVRRPAAYLRRVSFVFHYHPGAKGAQVGSTAGSKWHFKPFDGAKTFVRLEDHQFALLDQTMVKTVKNTARQKK
jgi:hypothetical protein